MKTFSVKSTDIKREWHVIDASGKVLGRLATEIARLLMGKNKPTFTRNLDTGDHVVVINAVKIVVTGNKEKNKIYYRHSGYPGGFKSLTYREMAEKHPTRALEKAVKGMLPHNRLGAAMFRKLRVYAYDTHPHAGQAGPLLQSSTVDVPEEVIAAAEPTIEVVQKEDI